MRARARTVSLLRRPLSITVNTYSSVPDFTNPARLTVVLIQPVFALIQPTAAGASLTNLSLSVPV